MSTTSQDLEVALRALTEEEMGVGDAEVNGAMCCAPADGEEV